MKIQLYSEKGEGITICLHDSKGKELTDLLSAIRNRDSNTKRTGILVYMYEGEWRIVPHPITSDGLMELSCMEFLCSEEVKNGVWIWPGLIHGNKLSITE